MCEPFKNLNGIYLQILLLCCKILYILTPQPLSQDETWLIQSFSLLFEMPHESQHKWIIQSQENKFIHQEKVVAEMHTWLYLMKSITTCQLSELISNGHMVLHINQAKSRLILDLIGILSKRLKGVKQGSEVTYARDLSWTESSYSKTKFIQFQSSLRVSMSL